MSRETSTHTNTFSIPLFEASKFCLFSFSLVPSFLSSFCLGVPFVVFFFGFCCLASRYPPRSEGQRNFHDGKGLPPSQGHHSPAWVWSGFQVFKFFLFLLFLFFFFLFLKKNFPWLSCSLLLQCEIPSDKKKRKKERKKKVTGQEERRKTR